MPFVSSRRCCARRAMSAAAWATRVQAASGAWCACRPRRMARHLVASANGGCSRRDGPKNLLRRPARRPPALGTWPIALQVRPRAWHSAGACPFDQRTRSSSGRHRVKCLTLFRSETKNIREGASDDGSRVTSRVTSPVAWTRAVDPVDVHEPVIPIARGRQPTAAAVSLRT